MTQVSGGNLLSVRQAAIFLGLSIERVKQLIYAGRLPADRIDRFWVLHEKDLVDFQLSRQIQNAPTRDQINRVLRKAGLKHPAQIRKWWNGPRMKLLEKTPAEAFPDDPEAVLAEAQRAGG